MEAKFTKGEWILNKSICPLTGISGEIEISSSDKSVCTWVALCHNEADAKLIASAPELLRHLTKCIEALELIGNETGQSMPLTVQDAKQAIKKATE